MKRLLRKWQAGWLIGLMLLLLVAGCTVNQKRDIQAYRDVLDGGKSDTAEPFHPDDRLTIVQALNLANAHNEQLNIAGEDYLQTLINKDRAFAAFLPTISLAPIFMRQDKTALSANNPLITQFVPKKTTDVPVEGRLNLHPFRDIPALQSAGASIRMQKARLLDRQATLMLNVARTYFQVMYSEARADVLRHSIKVGEQRLADIRVKQKVGVARPMDVSLAEAQLAGTRSRLIQAQNDVKNSRAMLALLTGVPAVDGPLANDLPISDTVPQVAGLMELAVSHRQDLVAAHEQVRAAADGLKAAWGEYFPSVSLDLAAYLSRESFPDDVDWTSMLRVNVPLFSAGLIHADVRTAYSRLRQARLFEIYVQRQITKDVKVALENLHGDERRIGQLNVRVRAARDGLNEADAAFDAGIGTSLERLRAQDDKLTAELTLSEAIFNRCVDYLNLLRATGTLTTELSEKWPCEVTTARKTKEE